jgi:predicted phage terminase large subunit-like protein
LSGTGLTTSEKEQLKLAAHAALAREDYLAYATIIDQSYEIAPHIRLLGGYLNAVEKGDIRKLAVIMPPRHGKSEATSGKFPGWCLGKDQDRCVMVTSYAASLAETFSIQNRDTVATNPRWRMVFPDVVLNPNVRGREKWALAGQRESVIAAGVGGSITGLGAWLLLIDDPVKNYEEAVSQARQEAIWNWYNTTARTRLTPDGRTIIIMTRWAEGDLLGRVLEADDEFVVVHLPATSYGTAQEFVTLYPDAADRAKQIEKLPQAAFPDPLGRARSAPLWPERFDETFLNEQAVQLGHDFESLYQGNPSAPEGTKFQRNWFRSITPDILAHLKLTPLVRARSYDLAWSEKEKADYTAGLRATLYRVRLPDPEEDEIPEFVRNYLKIVQLPPVMLVLEDLQRWKKEWPESSEKIIEIATADTEKYKLLLEAMAAQNVSIRSLKKDTRLWKHTIKGLPAKGDKEVRAKYGLALAEKGLVFVLYPTATAPPLWEKDFLSEHAAFPSGKNDDQVDAYTQLVNYLQPTIDRVLNKIPRGVWTTPFMAPSRSPLIGTNRPHEFRESSLASKLCLGWYT